MNYNEQMDVQNTLILRNLISELPTFCRDYFRGISASKALRTQVSYCRDLYTFFQFITHSNPVYANCDIVDLPFRLLEQLTPSDIDEYMEYLSFYIIDGKEYRNSSTSKARKLSALSNFFTFFQKRKLLSNNPIVAVERPAIHEKAIISLNQDQIFDLMEIVANPVGMSERSKKFHQITAERDLALFSLFLGTGIRVSELVGLNIFDVDFKNNSIKVLRKGGNEDLVYFSTEVADALISYVGNPYADETDDIDIPAPRDILLKNNTEEPALFISLRSQRISVRSVEVLVKKYSSMLKTNKKITPHKLRSTYGSELYRQTSDIYLVGETLGHKDINTTKRHYAKMTSEIKQRAANVVSLSRESD